MATNYRLGGFGFLGGQQLKSEGNTNLGLHDQRLAMQYVLLTPLETRGKARKGQGATLTMDIDGYRTTLPLSVVILHELLFGASLLAASVSSTTPSSMVVTTPTREGLCSTPPLWTPAPLSLPTMSPRPVHKTSSTKSWPPPAAPQRQTHSSACAPFRTRRTSMRQTRSPPFSGTRVSIFPTSLDRTTLPSSSPPPQKFPFAAVLLPAYPSSSATKRTRALCSLLLKPTSLTRMS